VVGAGRRWPRGRAGAAGVSLLVLVLFANGGDVQPLPSAAAMDVAVLVTLLWMHCVGGPGGYLTTSR
jgi:hypothetical protein